MNLFICKVCSLRHKAPQQVHQCLLFLYHVRSLFLLRCRFLRCRNPLPQERGFLHQEHRQNRLKRKFLCFQGNGEFPIAVFLGSDGMDDSFGADENLINFYVQIVKEIVQTDRDNVISEIEQTLPQLSKIGSKDDMSVAVVYNKEQLVKAYPKFLAWQIDSTQKTISAINKKIEEKKRKISDIEKIEIVTQKMTIEYNYAFTDMKKLYQEKSQLVKRIDILSQELYGESYTPYMDEIGLNVDNEILTEKKDINSEQ